MLRRAIRALGLSPPAPPRSPAAGAAPPLSLLDQSSLPPGLRLPRPADPAKRVAAGVVDLALAAAGGGAAYAAALHGASLPAAAAAAAGQGAALFLWAARDCLGDARNRSPGKALFRLEVALWDGAPAPPAAAALRSVYVLLLPLAGAHAYAALALDVLVFWDVATLALTPDARKAGDYALGTRVVDEAPGRAGRLADAADAAEARALRAVIEGAAPGLLARREAERPELAWYEGRAPAAAGGAWPLGAAGAGAQLRGHAGARGGAGAPGGDAGTAAGAGAAAGEGLPRGGGGAPGSERPSAAAGAAPPGQTPPTPTPPPRADVEPPAGSLWASAPIVGAAAAAVAPGAAARGGPPAPPGGGLFSEVTAPPPAAAAEPPKLFVNRPAGGGGAARRKA